MRLVITYYITMEAGIQKRVGCLNSLFFFARKNREKCLTQLKETVVECLISSRLWFHVDCTSSSVVVAMTVCHELNRRVPDAIMQPRKRGRLLFHSNYTIRLLHGKGILIHTHRWGRWTFPLFLPFLIRLLFFTCDGVSLLFSSLFIYFPFFLFCYLPSLRLDFHCPPFFFFWNIFNKEMAPISNAANEIRAWSKCLFPRRFHLVRL